MVCSETQRAALLSVMYLWVPVGTSAQPVTLLNCAILLSEVFVTARILARGHVLQQPVDCGDECSTYDVAS